MGFAAAKGTAGSSDCCSGLLDDDLKCWITYISTGSIIRPIASVMTSYHRSLIAEIYASEFGPKNGCVEP